MVDNNILHYRQQNGTRILEKGSTLFSHRRWSLMLIIARKIYVSQSVSKTQRFQNEKPSNNISSAIVSFFVCSVSRDNVKCIIHVFLTYNKC